MSPPTKSSTEASPAAFFVVFTVGSERDQSHNIIINKFSLSYKMTAAFGEILESRDRNVVTFLKTSVLICTGGDNAFG